MRDKVKTARPVARKGEARSNKKTAAVPSTRKSQPIIQLVERRSSPAMAAPGAEVVKKVGELPIPTATFVF